MASPTSLFAGDGGWRGAPWSSWSAAVAGVRSSSVVRGAAVVVVVVGAGAGAVVVVVAGGAVVVVVGAW